MSDEGKERAREGLEHLQVAAHELIAAARAALDVAEDLVDDPEAVASMVGAAGSLSHLLRGAAARIGGGNTNGGESGATEAEPQVEPIPLD